MTVEQLVDRIIQREVAPRERGRPWADVSAHGVVSDRGGWTKAGVTVLTLGQWRKLGRQATRQELESMTEAECRAIYAEGYVKPFEFVPDPLREQLVDWAVTSGHARPAQALQDALQERGTYLGKIDGVLGPKTREALLQDPEPRRTYNDVLKARLAFYRDIALRETDVRMFLHDHRSSQLHNLAGWQNRALDFVLS
jgi:lysozyme family protein